MITFLVLPAAIAVVGTGLVRYRALKTNTMIKEATERDMHTVPTPRGGGVGIVLGFLIAVGLLAINQLISLNVCLGLMVGGIMIAATGFRDDQVGLSSKLRFGIHGLSCIVALVAIGGLQVGISGPLLWFANIITWFLMVWLINLYNFMDGIDGLAASEGVLVGAAGALLAAAVKAEGLSLSFACIASASAGFLFWNWPRAKIFMGDVASGFLGYIFAVLFVLGMNAGISWTVWALLIGAFLSDTSVTLICRIANKEEWLAAHRSHAFQVAAMKTSHLKITLTVIGVNLLFLFPLAYLAWKNPALSPVLVVVGLGSLCSLVFRIRGGVKGPDAN